MTEKSNEKLMQDWFTDSHETLERAYQKREKNTRGPIKAAAVLALMFGIAGCSAWGQQEYVDASARTANYTEMYVDYTFYDTNGKNLGLGGDAKPFSSGGTGGRECCAMLPVAGQIVRLEWDEKTVDFDNSKQRHYTRDVVVIGSQAYSGDSYNYVITRFFPKQQVEVELVSVPAKDLGHGAPSPRLDQLFYGRSVMRHMGE